ncbi:MAG: hypothetical protein Q4F05_04235 [bacterium]|nr:hypothetical protein [bacterium]
MNFKKMWKSANRGVILGIFLVIIVTIYVIADQIIFNNEKGEINTVVTDYVDDYMATLKASDEVIKNKAWTKASGEKELTEFKDLINKYFAYSHYTSELTEMYYYIDRQTGEQQIKDAFSDEMLKETGYVTSTEHSISSVKIKKYGPQGAIVSFNLNAKITINGAYGFTNIDLEPWQDYSVNEQDGSIINDTSKPETRSNKIEVSVQLLREKGSWKISKIATGSFEYEEVIDTEVTQ